MKDFGVDSVIPFLEAVHDIFQKLSLLFHLRDNLLIHLVFLLKDFFLVGAEKQGEHDIIDDGKRQSSDKKHQYFADNSPYRCSSLPDIVVVIKYVAVSHLLFFLSFM